MNLDESWNISSVKERGRKHCMSNLYDGCEILPASPGENTGGHSCSGCSEI